WFELCESSRSVSRHECAENVPPNGKLRRGPSGRRLDFRLAAGRAHWESDRSRLCSSVSSASPRAPADLFRQSNSQPTISPSAESSPVDGRFGAGVLLPVFAYEFSHARIARPVLL